MAVANPFLTPKLSRRTRSVGHMQFKVHDPIETILCPEGSKESRLQPGIIVMSGLCVGALTRTLGAPFSILVSDVARSLACPLQSIRRSKLKADQSILELSDSFVQGILCPWTTIESGSHSTS